MNRLKELRKRLGLKQREVAERLGVDVGLVGSWEIGRPIPKVRKYQICKEYNVRREWLETGEGEMFEPEKDDLKRGSLRRCYASTSSWTRTRRRSGELLPRGFLQSQ